MGTIYWTAAMRTMAYVLVGLALLCCVSSQPRTTDLKAGTVQEPVGVDVRDTFVFMQDLFASENGAGEYEPRAGEASAPECPDRIFVCGGAEESQFSRCMEAIDCKMMTEMQTFEVEDSIVATFM